MDWKNSSSWWRALFFVVSSSNTTQGAVALAAISYESFVFTETLLENRPLITTSLGIILVFIADVLHEFKLPEAVPVFEKKKKKKKKKKTHYNPSSSKPFPPIKTIFTSLANGWSISRT